MLLRIAFLILLTIAAFTGAYPAWFNSLSATLNQPDGRIIDCFVSGDEYFNWYHDGNGFTIIQADDGYYYYAEKHNNDLIPGRWRVLDADPDTLSLTPWLKISEKEYEQRKESCTRNAKQITSAPTLGAINNPVVFIRFEDDAEFVNNRSFFDAKFNPDNAQSLKSYYKEVSYQKLSINSTYYPACASNVNLSYQDSHPRSYFQPYNSVTNVNGYVDNLDRTIREHTLLKDALTWLSINSPIPSTLNIDSDGDNYVDNLCFIIKGSSSGWSSLLWAHSWNLFTYDVLINGKHVLNYTFHPEAQSDVSTLCHEMFHTMGAPDLYHYENSGLQPIGTWDIMDSGFGHMGAYMKWKYTYHTWINSIPEITTSGNYNLFPVTSQWDNCFKIKSPYSNDEYFILEYRQKTGLYESNLPGSGLLAYKIDPVFNGNSSGPPDEIYLFRPGGSCTENGEPSFAYNSYESGRTTLNDTTDNNGFLGNCAPAGLMISNISSAGTSISFTVRISNVEPPAGLSANSAGTSSINLNWTPNANGNPVLLVSGFNNEIGNPMMGVGYSAGDQLPGGGTVIYCGPDTSFVHTGLNSNSHYFYKMWSFEPGYLYSGGLTANCQTDCAGVNLPYYEPISSPWLPNCWEEQSSEEALDVWRISNTSEAGGEPFELMIPSNFTSVDYSRMILPPLNTQGITKLGLSFRFNFLDQYQGTTIKIQTSNDRINWTDAGWSVISYNNHPHLAQLIQTSITTNLDSPVTYVAITITGSLWSFTAVYFDDFEMYIEECNFYQIYASAVPSEGGTVSGAGNFYPGQEVSMHAQPLQGWNFLGWKEDGQWISFTPDYSFIAESNHTFSAWFSQSQVRVSAIAIPEASGDCSGTGFFNLYTAVDLNAISAPDYEFDHWEENGQEVSGTASYSFTALSSRFFIAVFRPAAFPVDAIVSPSGTGQVQGTGIFEIHHTANLVATPMDGYQFIGWYENGSLVSALSEYSFEVISEHLLEARFYCPACNIVAVASPPEGGSIQGAGAFAGGESANLIASPNNSWVFRNWTEDGIQVSALPEYSFVVERYRDLVAHFLRIYNVKVTVTPNGSGNIIGDGQFVDGTAVTLGAFPNENFEFSCWKEGNDTLSTTNVLNFVVQSGRDILAVFKKVNGFGELSDSEFRIYPIPAKETLFLEIKNSTEVINPVAHIYDLTSRSWQMPVKALSTGIFRLDISNMASGNYFLRLVSSEGKLLGSGSFIIRN